MVKKALGCQRNPISFLRKKASEAYEKVRYRLLKIPYARRNAQVDSHKIVELMFLI